MDATMPDRGLPLSLWGIWWNAILLLRPAFSRLRTFMWFVDTVTIDGIAAREACSKRHVNMTISLAFLAPSLIKAAVEGRLPHGIGVARLFDAPVAWERQHEMLGLSHR